MQYQITSDNMEITPSMEALAKQKFARIEHRFKDVDDGSKSARIVLNSAPGGMFTVKGLIVVKGKEYFSDETDYNLESALVKTVEEILQMAEKGSDYEKHRKKELTAEELMEIEAEE